VLKSAFEGLQSHFRNLFSSAQFLNCTNAVAEQYFFKKLRWRLVKEIVLELSNISFRGCGYVAAEVLPTNCGTAIGAGRKSCATFAYINSVH
jgi:hypothetical protein